MLNGLKEQCHRRNLSTIIYLRKHMAKTLFRRIFRKHNARTAFYNSFHTLELSVHLNGITALRVLDEFLKTLD